MRTLFESARMAVVYQGRGGLTADSHYDSCDEVDQCPEYMKYDGRSGLLEELSGSTEFVPSVEHEFLSPPLFIEIM